jgi:methionyl-tRNA formyltransferase
MNIVFMGTPEFGATILSELVKQHNVVLVVTQPDKLVGRKREIEFSAVKKKAIELDIPVYQPINIRQEYQYIIDNYEFDMIVTAAYGQIIGTKLLYYPKYKSINVHGSLLPKHRGGAPIQRSIINGDSETGITIMYMAKGMDSGDILAQESLKIELTDNSDSLFIKLADLGAKMINPTIDKLVKNEITPIKQKEEEVTYSPNISHEEELLDFNQLTNIQVFNKIRGLSSNPGAYFKIDNFTIKVYESELVESKTNVESSIICDVAKDSFSISCLNGTILKFKSIKPEGKGIMNVKDFLNGKGRTLIIKGKKVN